MKRYHPYGVFERRVVTDGVTPTGRISWKTYKYVLVSHHKTEAAAKRRAFVETLIQPGVGEITVSRINQFSHHWQHGCKPLRRGRPDIDPFEEA